MTPDTMHDLLAETVLKQFREIEPEYRVEQRQEIERLLSEADLDAGLDNSSLEAFCRTMWDPELVRAALKLKMRPSAETPVDLLLLLMPSDGHLE